MKRMILDFNVVCDLAAQGDGKNEWRVILLRSDGNMGRRTWFLVPIARYANHREAFEAGYRMMYGPHGDDGLKSCTDCGVAHTPGYCPSTC